MKPVPESSDESTLLWEVRFNKILLETTGALIVVLNNQGNVVRFNQACEKLTGYSKEEMQGKFVWDVLLVPDEIKPVKNVFQKLSSGMFPSSYKNIWLTKTGEQRYIIWENTAIVNDDGEVEYVIGTGIDITEQQQAEDALKEREHDYRTLAENIPAIVYRTTIKENQRTTQFFNEMVTTISGYSPFELMHCTSGNCGHFIHEQDQHKLETAIKAAVNNNKPFEIEYRLKRKDGELRFVIDSGRPITSRRTGEIYIDGTISDITNQKHLLHELTESENKFKDLAEKSPVGIYMIQENAFSYTNPRFSEIFGFDREELIGMDPIDRISDEDKPTAINNLKSQIEGGMPTVHMKLHSVKKDGNIIDVDIYGSRTEYRAKPAVIGTLVDITRQRIIEQALQEQILRYEQILHTSMDGFLLMESSGKILDANPAFCEMLGYTYHEFIELNIKELQVNLVPEHSLKTIDQYTGEQTGVFESQYRHKDGHLIDMEVSINIMPSNETSITAIFARNITKRKHEQNLEHQRLFEYAHASRLITMGEMATELAHELNQPLSAITTYSDAVKILLDVDSIDNQDITDALQAISTQAKRAGDIIHSLRDFVSKNDSHPTPTNINELILLTLKLVNAEAILNNITIQFKSTEKLPDINAEKILVEQVILNLIRNAMEALTETDKTPRKIEITTGLNENSMIEVNVKDNGPGLSFDNPNQVFESFLTTKSAGMGMGLTISRNIIEAHDGVLVARNRKPHGACFTFTLPVFVHGD